MPLAQREAAASGVGSHATLAAGDLPVSSVVIHSVGANYVEEALLSGMFAVRYAPELAEIVIFTDQSAATFSALPAKPRVATLRDETRGSG